MNALAESAVALRNPEVSYGVTLMSDHELMETTGGWVWWAPIAMAGGAAIAGVAVGVLIYALVN